MKTYKERTESILKKTRALKKRRARICLSAATSSFVVLLSFVVAIGMLNGVNADGGDAPGEYAPNVNVSSNVMWGETETETPPAYSSAETGAVEENGESSIGDSSEDVSEE